ncbi:hypothetical protein SAMN04487948_1328 [Halogranum amylolyticum]|uniref:Uncharacterized protein n=1 Tax=Halogranum amylolyticum TaxID=660520 RepID=A0A1H8WK63_9EURY|nr:hypothetical protein [Halogranum amylolyticum]SEP28012.1 hypothetical protein SAMN04487948_1328 [Halogranum amylolyticum]
MSNPNTPSEAAVTRADSGVTPPETNAAKSIARRPTTVGSVVAVVAAVVAVGLVGTTDAQRLALGVDVAGIVVLALGGTAWHRGHRLTGGLLALAGVGISLASVGVVVTQGETVSERVEVAPGLLGPLLVACGVLPVWRRFSRTFVSLGAAFVVLTIGLSGLVHGTGMLSLLGAFTATIVAWDAGEQAINLGEQLGVDARTWPVEVSHSAATALYGGVAVAAAVGFHDLNVTNVPLVGLFALFGAAVLLLVGLYN